jgi:hypothetical protein
MVTETHIRDSVGELLWVDPYECDVTPGQEIWRGETRYLVTRQAIANHIQHVNVEPYVEDEIILEPHL